MIPFPSLPNILLGVLYVNTFFAQNYTPVIKEDAHWITEVYSPGPVVYPFAGFCHTVKGDTLFNGIAYKKLYKKYFHTVPSGPYVTLLIPYQVDSFHLWGLVREDSVLHKIFWVNINAPSQSCPTGVEQVLLDFSVQQGDTLPWCHLAGNNASVFADSIWIDSMNKRHIQLILNNNFLGPLTKEVIEGFGFSPGGLFEYYEEYCAQTLPFCLLKTVYCVGTDLECGILASTSATNLPEISIYPNPVVYGMLTVDIPETYQSSCSITLSDQNCRIVRTYRADSLPHLDVAAIPPGVYSISVQLSHGILTRKIVFLSIP